MRFENLCIFVRNIFPDLSIEQDDLETARKLARKLVDWIKINSKLINTISACVIIIIAIIIAITQQY